jgi:DNA-binding transcriptional LysR family regulator
MDTLLNIKAFLATARAGSFSAAARQLGVAPSVIVKRINRLEDQMRAQLFIRSTRRLDLTETGERYFPRYQALVRDVEDALNGANSSPNRIEGHLRIKCPTTLTVLNFGAILNEYQIANPGVSIEVALIDRSVNPIEEGFDIAIGAMPASYPNVVDEPLSRYPRVLCAAPSYLAERGEPMHPIDLIEHDCLTFLTTGTTWSFESQRGLISVDVRARFIANDSQVLRDAACRGLGLAVMARYIARPSIETGALKELLPEYPIPELWLKALVPVNRMKKVGVQSLLRWIKDSMHPWAQ